MEAQRRSRCHRGNSARPWRRVGSARQLAVQCAGHLLFCSLVFQMSTKKIILIVAGIFAVLGLLVALFVGGIAWFTFHTIASSEAAEPARTYLWNDEDLNQYI